jgi:prephenate dehydrogenase
VNRVNVTIVGLGLVGTSIGLALKAAAPEISIMGHDPDVALSKRARKLGAIDTSHWNLISACESADLVLLNLPVEELEGTLSALRGELKEQAVVVETTPVKRPVMDLVRCLGLDSTRFVGGLVVSPRLLAQAEPSAQLLRGATFHLVASSSASPGALATASNLAEAVGATPHFVSAAEHDGLVAAMAQLPLLGALAMVGALKTEPGDRDRKCAAGGEFAAVSSILSDTLACSAGALLSNADNLVHWLDVYVAQLLELRNLLSGRDSRALGESLVEAIRTCDEWLAGEPAPTVSVEGSPSGWRSLFLGNLGRRTPR